MATALVSFWILPVTERWYSLKSLACCRMLLRYSWGGGGTPPGALGAAWGVPQSHARSLAGIHLIECLNPYLWGRGELLEENTPLLRTFLCAGSKWDINLTNYVTEESFHAAPFLFQHMKNVKEGRESRIFRRK